MAGEGLSKLRHWHSFRPSAGFRDHDHTALLGKMRQARRIPKTAENVSDPQRPPNYSTKVQAMYNGAPGGQPPPPGAPGAGQQGSPARQAAGAQQQPPTAPAGSAGAAAAAPQHHAAAVAGGRLLGQPWLRMCWDGSVWSARCALGSPNVCKLANCKRGN